MTPDPSASRGTHIVTGASTGIGAEIVRSLWAENRDVLGIARNRPSWWQGRFVECDFAQDGDLSIVEDIIKAIPHVAAIVNCAADGYVDAVDSADLLAMRRAFQVNVFAPAMLVKAALSRMSRGGGVVNIGSCIMNGRSGRASYAASKAALASLTRTWAQELGPRGITCNMISPGPTETEGYRTQNPAAGVAEVSLLARIPTGRINTPADVAACVSFLLRSEMKQITGQILTVDGGLTIGL